MKRGASGLSLVVAIDKPSGLSSHDVVNRVRRIFGERRVGHTGTLDPLASGVLPVCVGSATRLDAAMTAHDKRYRVRVVFGEGTETDDSEGAVTKRAPVPPEVSDPVFAKAFVETLTGPAKQFPPVYSAIKVNGRKACDEARKGRIIELAPRDIEVYEARLIGLVPPEEGGLPAWDVAFHVSAGCYIRSLARDMGTALSTCAHVGELRRTAAGRIGLDESVSLEVLEEVGAQATLDPLKFLGLRFAYLDEAGARAVSNGAPLPADAIELCERRTPPSASEYCACTAGVCESEAAPEDGEVVALVAANKLVALYAFDEARRRYKAKSVFSPGVSRGCDI